MWDALRVSFTESSTGEGSLVLDMSREICPVWWLQKWGKYGSRSGKFGCRKPSFQQERENPSQFAGNDRDIHYLKYREQKNRWRAWES